MKTLPERLKIKAQMISLGEKIALGSDSAIMLESAAELDRLNTAIKWEQNRAERIGTHGPNCHTWGPSHYECAMRVIDEQLGENKNLLAAHIECANHFDQLKEDYNKYKADAERYVFLSNYLVGDRTDLDDQCVAARTKSELDIVIDAALAAQGEAK